MENIILNMFSEKEIEEYKNPIILNNMYNELDKDITSGKLNFYLLVSNEYYRMLLPKYLKLQGYGYLCNEAAAVINKYFISDINVMKSKIAALLLDAGIIKRIPMLINNPFQNNKTIQYSRSKGLKQDFIVTYNVENNFPFNIKAIEYTHKDVIQCVYENSNKKKEVKVSIQIDKDKICNFSETIVVYTDYNMFRINFTITCDERNVNRIKFKNFRSYLLLCKSNYHEAKKIFYRKEFRGFLQQQEEVVQLMNYDESKAISTETSKDHFDIFLKMNLVFIQDKSIVKNPIVKNPIVDIDKEEINKLCKSIEENKPSVETTVNIDNDSENIDNDSESNGKSEINDNEIKEAKGEDGRVSTEIENKGVFEQVKDFLKKKFDNRYINK